METGVFYQVKSGFGQVKSTGLHGDRCSFALTFSFNFFQFIYFFFARDYDLTFCLVK